MLKRKWQIDNDQSPYGRTRNDLAVVDHLLEGCRNRGGATGDNHGHAISHKHAVDSGSIDQSASWPIVGRDHREWPAILLGGRKVGESYTAA